MQELDQLLTWCDNEYTSAKHCQCGNACTNGNFCKGTQTNCYSCIQHVHSYSNRTYHYNCDKMVLYYTLKHCYRFGAEVFYEMNRLRTDICNWQNISIDSIGCGPCSELFGALSFWRTIGKNDTAFRFRGFDTEPLWQPIMNQVQAVFQTADVRTFGQDAFAYYAQSQEPVDVIILNYMLSDMMKFRAGQYDNFLNNLITMIQQKKPRYLLVNDVYLLVSVGATNRMLRFLKNAGLTFKMAKLQYHSNHPYIGQFGRQVAKQPFVMSNVAIVQRYDPFAETNSIQTLIKFQ